MFIDGQRSQYEETLSLLLGDKRRAEGEAERARGELDRVQAMVGIQILLAIIVIYLSTSLHCCFIDLC